MPETIQILQNTKLIQTMWINETSSIVTQWSAILNAVCIFIPKGDNNNKYWALILGTVSWFPISIAIISYADQLNISFWTKISMDLIFYNSTNFYEFI